MVSNGSAHHTRREVPSEAGGGGGRGTLEPAVTRSLLFMASMTVTEVTTRIAVVGVVSLLGLLFVARRPRQTMTSLVQPEPTWGNRNSQLDLIVDYPRTKPFRAVGTRLTGLFATIAAAGITIGVVFSLVLVVLLNALSLK